MSTAVYEYKRAKTRQRGVAAVELALVAIPFFLMFLGAIEFGRLMYVWNTVQEVTRNAARQAVVSNFDAATKAGIRNFSVFRTTAGPLPAAAEITDANIKIRYLNAAGNVANINGSSTPTTNNAACLDSTRLDECIRHVEVCVVITSQANTNATCAAGTEVSFSPMIGFFTNLNVLKIPRSTVRMPAESMGFVPLITP